jgi:hypothetical protein
VKTDSLITKLLKSELSDASKVKLSRLINIMNSEDEKALYKPLIDALKTDKTIQLVFDYAEMRKQTNAQLLYAGYIDSSAVMLKFSISRRTLSKWCKKGILSGKYFGGKSNFLVKDVENLFLKNYSGTIVNSSPKRLKKIVLA